MHKFLFIFVSLNLKWSTCQRRITNGSSVDYSTNTNFMISIVSSKAMDTIPGWLCGGCIIHPSLLLTSASCLHTVTQMYAIIGYRKYVRAEDLKLDNCAKYMKKKITYYCLHSEYGKLENNKDDKHTSEERKYKWTIFDIGIARTETPIDFFDTNYMKYCSYMPNSIQVNYHAKFAAPGVNVVVYGWGHAAYYRPVSDNTDYNTKTLQYASSRIISKKSCESQFNSRYIRANINTNYICTHGKGNLNSHGVLVRKASPGKYKCGSRRRLGNYSKADVHQNTKCVDDTNSEETKLINETHNSITLKYTRRNGICQNDHGNPLVRWIGGHAYVIGVASAFQVNKKMECVGPYLYTSVHCTSRFVHCILSEQNTLKTRRIPSYCNASDIERGYKIEETYVDWSDERTNVPKSESDYSLYDYKESDSKDGI